MSRRSMPYHRRYHCDALNGYMTLSLEERGAYTTLLDLMYDMGGPITSDRRRLSGYLGCTLAKVDKLLASLIEQGKIYRTPDGKLSNRRAEQELQYSLELSQKNAEKRLKTRPKPSEFSGKDKENNGHSEPLLNRSSIIPEPEPDIIDSSEYDAAREDDRAAADAIPIRRETFRHETVATRLMRSGTGAVSIGAESGRRLTEALDRKNTSRWPVPVSGRKPT